MLRSPRTVVSHFLMGGPNSLGGVMSGRPVGVTFPNQFSLGNPENVSGKLEIHFDDLIVESIQRKTFREIQKAESGATQAGEEER